MSKIRPDTFVVISKFDGDAEWINEYTNNYQIYDKSVKPELYPKPFPLGYRSIGIPNVGYNLYAYFTYIIEHYENLPERIMFIKNNVIGRHVSKKYFESVMNNDFFTGLFDPSFHGTPKFPDAKIENGEYYERDGLNYYHKTMYVSNLKSFMGFVYLDASMPSWFRFAPGANYIVPKGQILRLPKSLYQDMRILVEHNQFSGESHIVERFLDLLWTQTDRRLNLARDISKIK